MRLFIDDERKTPSNFTHAAATVDDAIYLLICAQIEGEPVELISFDWDAHKWKAITFRRVAEWMIENNFWPQAIRIHSASPDRSILERLLRDNAPATTDIDYTDPWDYKRIGDKENPFPDWVEPFVTEVMS